MPSHQERREPLPKDYRFGDAGEGKRVILLEADEFIVGVLTPNVTTKVKPGLVRLNPDEQWNQREGGMHS